MAAAGISGSLPGIDARAPGVRDAGDDPALCGNFLRRPAAGLFKAARIDGGGFWRIFFQLVLPMSTPILIVAAIMQDHQRLERLHHGPHLRRPRGTNR